MKSTETRSAWLPHRVLEAQPGARVGASDGDLRIEPCAAALARVSSEVAMQSTSKGLQRWGSDDDRRLAELSVFVLLAKVFPATGRERAEDGARKGQDFQAMAEGKERIHTRAETTPFQDVFQAKY